MTTVGVVDHRHELSAALEPFAVLALAVKPRV
jgi:hypothetical protein